jgi:hypothetical protein
MVVAMGEISWEEAKWDEAKNVLFCLKNIGLAKEPAHTPALFLKQNDIVDDRKSHSEQMPLNPLRVVVET